MRAKLCFGAALAATVLTLVGCQITAISDSDSQGSIGVPVGQITSQTTNGNCSATIFENSSKALSGGILILNVGETAQLSDSITTNPRGCVSTAHHWTSSDTTVVMVGTTTGLVTAIRAGTAQVCDIIDAAPTIMFCFTVQVNGIVPTGKTPTSITVQPNPDTYPVGTVKTPTVTVHYSDNTTSTAAGSFTCTSANSGIVAIVNTSTCQESGVGVGTVNVTFCATGSTTVCTVQAVNVTSGIQIQTLPTSININIGTGCTNTQTFAVSVNGAAPTIPVTVTISPTTVATVSGSGGSWTFTGVAVGNATATVSAGGISVQVPIVVTNTPCTTGGPSIDYTPHGGNIALNATVTTLATCNLSGGATCGDKEFWSSTHPEIHDVNATDGFQNVSGFNWPVGPHGKVVSIASGTSLISVQASLTNATLKATWAWVTP
ncbi:hypothetical protein KW800_02425 [Candidatus Parcubacteria bacterium]|nr:hypothetical protein [Candidatus Parcubacteria bacterium]